MCGLVGIAGNLEVKDEPLMKRLFWFDYWRGPDSTGLAAIDKEGGVQISKIHSHPATLFEMSSFKKALDGNNSLVWLGHNRAATRGKITLHNTHPFQSEHIIGAHNGTLAYFSHQKLTKELGEEFEVDSEAIIAAIAKFGVKKTIAMLNGAWSLTYVDLKKGTLNFIRNDERPMWQAFLKNKDGVVDKLVWASDWWIIDSALKGYSGDLWKDDKGDTFFSTTKDTHFSFDISALRAGSKNRPKPKANVMKGDERPLSSRSSNGYGWPSNGSYMLWKDDEIWDKDPNNDDDNILLFMPRTSAGRSRNSTTRSLIGFDKPNREPQHFDSTAAEPFAGRISRERFDELIAAYRGCCWCGEEIKWEEAKGVTIFDAQDKILCSNCSTSGFTGTNRIYLRA